MKAGAFESLLHLPVGWTIAIDNHASWRTHMKADALVAAAALDFDELRQLHIRATKNEFYGLKFSVSGDLLVTSDFEKVKKVRLTSTKFRVSQTDE